MKKKIIIGSRASKLALIYAQIAKDEIIRNTNLSSDDILIKKIITQGDQVQNMRLSEVGGKGLFSSKIEKELQDKKIDVAVHALKDLPAIETNGLITDIFLERNDPREILITANNKKLKELKQNSIIGTSSYRREFQVKKIRQDVQCELIRGNVDTRIKKLNDKLYDAIILSYAGIKSLNMSEQISEIFSVSDIIPSVGQGIISLQCRENDNEIFSLLKKINHKETYQRAIAERNVLKVLEGDCNTAIGAHASIERNKIILEAELFSLDGTKRFYEKKVSEIENANKLGEEVGEILKLKSNNTYKK
ncbi:hydroxymethylbilane synthase [Pelagibacterales bacterium SAG-MED13]|nr:hydroxymethylbilane synthase [Pelagibacterales bacterium SAG-MED13]|tara:strand:- start:674 stop:1591 length:918 start_codon:yes stop_codon:yes gene_type:complete